MDDLHKLRILLSHWIEHNQEHTDEFRRWIDRAGDSSADILAAIEHMTQASSDLERALERLGGPAEHMH
jgi:hypothetical protein